MDENIFKGKWNELKGQARQKWAKLTDNDLQSIKGKQEELSGILQKKYGYSKDQAKTEIDNFIKQDKK